LYKSKGDTPPSDGFSSFPLISSLSFPSIEVVSSIMENFLKPSKPAGQSGPNYLVSLLVLLLSISCVEAQSSVPKTCLLGTAKFDFVRHTSVNASTVVLMTVDNHWRGYSGVDRGYPYKSKSKE
jgi:hypothetical protein